MFPGIVARIQKIARTLYPRKLVPVNEKTDPDRNVKEMSLLSYVGITTTQIFGLHLFIVAQIRCVS